MLPNDEIEGKQCHLQQYVEVLSKNVSRLQPDIGLGNAMLHKNVTFHPEQEFAATPHRFREDERLGADGVTNLDAQPMNLNPLAHSFAPPSNSVPNKNTPTNVKQNCQPPSIPVDNVGLWLPAQGWNLLPIEPTVFSGEPMDFPLWIKKLKIFVEDRTTNGSVRLAYLDKYTRDT